MENLNAKEYDHENISYEERIAIIYKIAKDYIEIAKQTTYGNLISFLLAKTNDFLGADCISAILKLKDDSDIEIDGEILPYPFHQDFNITIRYVKQIKQEDGRDDSLPAYIEAIRYLRSKFPNMIIDLEPELPNSTTATASNLVITNKKCPICGELMYVDNGVVLTSNPPQYRFVCKICKHTETGRHDNTATIGFGIASSEIAGIGITAEYLKNESERTGLHPAEIAINQISRL